MIALEILDYFRSEQIANGYTPFLLEMYNEAIAELKALQQRSCEWCKSFNGTQICNNFIARSGYKSNTFCCNRYEAKEQ